jgi:hypothetical protein
MVGRKRETAGINNRFTYEVTELKKNLELNINFDADIKAGFNIIVLAHQPGIGKTYNALEYMKKHPNTFYFTDRHRAIDEHTSVWDKDGIEYNHWRGFQQICTDEEIKSKSSMYHLSPDEIINNFNWMRKKGDLDKYNNQFQKRNRVFAPFNYLKYSAFTEHLPDVVFIDERISQLEVYNFDLQKIITGLELIKAPLEFIENATKRNCYYFLDDDVRAIIKNLYLEKIIMADKTDDYELKKQLKDFNVNELFGYCHWGRIYNYNSDVYAVPYYYYAFDVVAQRKPIIILDASFNQALFHYFLETYNGETRAFEISNRPGFDNVKVNVKIYSSRCVTNNTKIYRMRPRGAWPRASIIGSWESKSKEWISRDMRAIMDVFGSGNVGVISFKDLCEEGQVLGADFEYFGGLRGSNILEDKPVLVIIGGWFPPIPSWKIPPENRKANQETLDNLVRKYFLKNITKDDSKDAFVGAPSSIETSHEFLLKGIAHLTTDKQISKGKAPADIVEAIPISMINTMYFDEMYQAFHRNRGLRYPRIIFVYGWFPEPDAVYHFRDASEDNERRVEQFIDYKLRWEFGENIEKIENESIEDEPYKNGLLFFDWLATQYSQGKVLRILREFEKGERCKSPTDLANLYKIWEGPAGGINNKLVKDFKRIYEEMKEAGKVKIRSKKK